MPHPALGRKTLMPSPTGQLPRSHRQVGEFQVLPGRYWSGYFDHPLPCTLFLLHPTDGAVASCTDQSPDRLDLLGPTRKIVGPSFQHLNSIVSRSSSACSPVILLSRHLPDTLHHALDALRRRPGARIRPCRFYGSSIALWCSPKNQTVPAAAGKGGFIFIHCQFENIPSSAHITPLAS